MNRYRRTWQRARHAGFSNAFAAGISRAQNRLAALPLIGQVYRPSAELTEAAFYAAITHPGSNAEKLTHLLAAPSPHPFAGFNEVDETIAALRAKLPSNIDTIITEADAVLRHEFSFLGKSHRFGDSIDWHWCPENGGSWPFLPSADYATKASYYRADRPGDVKYPWELNRHQYFVTLAKAYRITGDTKYADEIARQVDDWIEKNPYRQGMNWVSTMEVSIRLIAWVNAYSLCRGTEAFNPPFLARWLQSMLQHARHINAHFTTNWLVRNNHLLGEAAGLFLFATLFPEFRESKSLQQRAYKLFTRELVSQTYPDGVNREQATGYHRFVIDFVWLVYFGAQRHALDFPKHAADRIERMLEYEHAMTAPDGHVPKIGDCDDGRGYILEEGRDFDNYQSWLTVAATEFDRPDLRATSDPPSEEALWLLGPDQWIADAPVAITPAQSTLFRIGGQAILRQDDHYVHLRCGDFGAGGPGASSHSHADLLSIVVYWRGRALFVDPGTYAYLCETEQRDYFRATSAHNTVAPAGIEQAQMVPLKDWGEVPSARVLEWHDDADETRLKAAMTANQFTHTRELALSRDQLTIRDTLSRDTTPTGTIQAHFHLAPDLHIELDTDHAIVHANGTPIARLNFTGYDDAAVTESWHSPSYGIKIATHCLILTTKNHPLDATLILTNPQQNQSCS